MTKPRILICTCCDSSERASKFELLTESKRKYASKHEGIDFLFEKRWTDRKFTPMWEKIPMLLDHMDDGYDYLLWVDDDAGFIRFDTDLRDHIPSDGKRFYFTQSRIWYVGELYKNVTILDNLINSGVFLVKCCEENKDVLNTWYGKRFKPEGVYPDQSTIIRWYLKNMDSCGFVNTKIFNAYPEVEPDGTCIGLKTKDTVILHFPGGMKRLKEKYFNPGMFKNTKPSTVDKSVSSSNDDWED